jgi:hypothetical protein
MKLKYKMSLKDRQELEEYRATGLSPRQIKSIERDAAEMREYLEWLQSR